MKSKDYLKIEVYLIPGKWRNEDLIDKCKIKSLVFYHNKTYINVNVNEYYFTGKCCHYGQYFIRYIVGVDNIELLREHMVPSTNNDKKYDVPKCISIEFINDISMYSTNAAVYYCNSDMNIRIRTNVLFYDADVSKLLISNEERDNIIKENVLSAVNTLHKESYHNEEYDDITQSLSFISLITTYISQNPYNKSILDYICDLIIENEELAIPFNIFIKNITGMDLDTVIKKVLNND